MRLSSTMTTWTGWVASSGLLVLMATRYASSESSATTRCFTCAVRSWLHSKKTNGFRQSARTSSIVGARILSFVDAMTRNGVRQISGVSMGSPLTTTTGCSSRKTVSAPYVCLHQLRRQSLKDLDVCRLISAGLQSITAAIPDASEDFSASSATPELGSSSTIQSCFIKRSDISLLSEDYIMGRCGVQKERAHA